MTVRGCNEILFDVEANNDGTPAVQASSPHDSVGSHKGITIKQRVLEVVVDVPRRRCDAMPHQLQGAGKHILGT